MYAIYLQYFAHFPLAHHRVHSPMVNVYSCTTAAQCVTSQSQSVTDPNVHTHATIAHTKQQQKIVQTNKSAACIVRQSYIYIYIYQIIYNTSEFLLFFFRLYLLFNSLERIFMLLTQSKDVGQTAQPIDPFGNEYVLSFFQHPEYAWAIRVFVVARIFDKSEH